MGLKKKFSNFFFLEDEQAVDQKEPVDTPVEKKQTPNYTQQSSQANKKESHSTQKTGGLNVVSMNQKPNAAKPKITLVEPRLYSEVKDIADIVLSNQSVILNFRRMEQEQARQTIDFLMGISYAVKGDIQRIGDQIFVCTPESVELDGDELNAMQDQGL